MSKGNCEALNRVKLLLLLVLFLSLLLMLLLLLILKFVAIILLLAIFWIKLIYHHLVCCCRLLYSRFKLLLLLLLLFVLLFLILIHLTIDIFRIATALIVLPILLEVMLLISKLGRGLRLHLYSAADVIENFLVCCRHCGWYFTNDRSISIIEVALKIGHVRLKLFHWKVWFQGRLFVHQENGNLLQRQSLICDHPLATILQHLDALD